MKVDLLIKNVHIVAAQSIIRNGAVAVKNGHICAIFSSFQELQEANVESTTTPANIIDGQQQWLLPGFIDIHIHGGYGGDFMSANIEQYNQITQFHAAHGTTSLLATTMTAPKTDIIKVLTAVQTYQQQHNQYAEVIGVHLEGPFISPQFPGAQNPKHISLAQKDWLEDWLQAYPDLIKLLTMAPEREGALTFIDWLSKQGVVVACGHTDATHDEIKTAAEHGLSHAVHTFNAMRGLHHREPGTLGAILADQRISAEIIADGHHVHPTCIQLLHRLKGDHLVLITDAMAAAGLGNGDYQLGDLDVVVQDGVARLKNNDSLAGSTLTMIQALQFVIQNVGLSLLEASRMASLHPAKVLGIDHHVGSISLDKQADLLLLDEQLSVQKVWKKGQSLNML